MNSVYSDLKFTTEVAEDVKDGRLPTLDFTIEEMIVWDDGALVF